MAPTGGRRRLDGEPETPSEALSHPLRRQVLRDLQDVSEPLSLADLAIASARRGADDPTRGVDWEHAQQLRIRLYHQHVPMLAEAGLVEYDPARTTVALEDVAESSGLSSRE